MKHLCQYKVDLFKTLLAMSERFPKQLVWEINREEKQFHISASGLFSGLVKNI